MLTLVKQWSAWAITSETSPTTPNDPFGQPWPNFGQNPNQKPLEHSLPPYVTRNFCRVLTQNPHLAPSTQQVEQAGLTHEQIPKRASQFS
jgi:hypothetical protein